MDSFLCDALDLPEDKGLGIDQVVPLPIVAGGPQLHQHDETDQGLPSDALPGDAGRGSQPLSAAAEDGDAIIFVRIGVHLS